MWWKKQELGMQQDWGAHMHAWKMWMQGPHDDENGKCKGKGKAKGKGKGCKGKGKCKRSASEAGMFDTEMDCEPKAKCGRNTEDSDVKNTNMKCASPGCNFQRT